VGKPLLLPSRARRCPSVETELGIGRLLTAVLMALVLSGTNTLDPLSSCKLLLKLPYWQHEYPTHLPPTHPCFARARACVQILGQQGCRGRRLGWRAHGIAAAVGGATRSPSDSAGSSSAWCGPDNQGRSGVQRAAPCSAVWRRRGEPCCVRCVRAASLDVPAKHLRVFIL
jgi:hypothetical protein